MFGKRAAYGMFVGAFVTTLFAVAAPASAQLGGLRGKVVDESGAPVADAMLTFDYLGELNLHFSDTKTNAKGEWLRGGLQAVGRWNITAKKGDLSGRASSVEVPLGATSDIPNIVLKKGGVPAGGPGADPAAAARAKQMAELSKILGDVNTALAAKDWDTAIAKLTETNGKVEKCGVCYARLGDVYTQKGDQANAEQSYLKAIEFDPTAPDSYEALSNLYNGEKKYDDATKMGQKARELRAASGGGGGGGDATSVFNQGVIFWNQNKIAEAKAQFAQAVQINPKMADAHYYLAMTLVNEGNMAGAKPEFEEYLKLSPTGENADTAKALLDSMK